MSTMYSYAFTMMYDKRVLFVDTCATSLNVPIVGDTYIIQDSSIELNVVLVKIQKVVYDEGYPVKVVCNILNAKESEKDKNKVITVDF